ncbi:hypothetical protein [Candidatus Chloroploca asiatica]|uniref:Uncharacterized protein n=1 Tax=Candidatus Chloroploca asiatica TaxID=1506545 RepID=A0A2H3KJZ9_9CHLR|nr:hypothetical protein [Candidatus Chloroploca asiatica]PDV97493.1 hypothetical protein A9Q02_18035 [Candidatus Chloroploca asiatica]
MEAWPYLAELAVVISGAAILFATLSYGDHMRRIPLAAPIESWFFSGFALFLIGVMLIARHMLWLELIRLTITASVFFLALWTMRWLRRRR